jgi:hypothetical protein
MRKQYRLGHIDVPVKYCEFSNEQKIEIQDNLIDSLLHNIDKNLPPEINRITFLSEVLESSLITNEKMELYEVCQVINDTRKRLNVS